MDSSGSSESRRCSECVQSKVRCDLRDDPWGNHVPSLSDWASIEKQKQRLEEQEEEAMAKILRLRKQKRLLIEREREMACRGLKYLDELDKAEQKEREEEGRREQELTTATSLPAPSKGDVLDFLGWRIVWI